MRSKMAFSQRIVPVWNSLPEEVVTAETTEKFKENLDKHWTNQAQKYQFKSHMTGVMRNGVINLCWRLAPCRCNNLR